MLSTDRWPVKAIALLLCGSLLLWASGIAPQAYRTVQANSSSATPAPTLNFQDTGTVTWACSTAAGVTTCQATGAAGSGTALPNYSQGFTSQTSVTLTHNAGTTALVIECYDNASPPNLIVPQNIALTDANNAAVTFSSSQSGKCIVNSSGVSTGGGIVLGFATKTSAYVFTNSDYAVDGDTTGGSFSVKLEASPTTGQIHALCKPAVANVLTLDGNGKNINGSATQALAAQYSCDTVQYNGTEWRIE